MAHLAPAAAAATDVDGGARLRLPNSPGVPATRLLPRPEPVEHLLREDVLAAFDRAQYEHDGSCSPGRKSYSSTSTPLVYFTRSCLCKICKWVASE